MTATRLIVCERTGRWAVALRAEMAGLDVRVSEVRSVPDACDALARWPASLLVVEFTRGNARAVLDCLTTRAERFPLARIAVVAERRYARFEWALREAGAVYFSCSPRALRPLRTILIRHAKQAPRVERSLTEQIWQSLPWGRET